MSLSACRIRAARRLAPCLAAVLLTGSAGCTIVTSGGHARGGSAHATASSQGRQVRLDVVSQGGQTIAFVPVTIQGHGPFRFVLDTGASSSAVDSDVARKLDLPRTGERQPITGVTGTEKASQVRLRSWKAGTVDLGAADATVIHMKTPQGGVHIQGLLGSDVLSRFGTITVDYKDQVLLLPSS
ncbi:aspartyl protease family protein [Streptomyces sp. NPDC014983]|uniref:aspartyl protease family protein n=1 Tax=Streptomyces sp. NPDC014983 TaxID=3364933 RepID=UPI0036F96251